MSEAAGSGWGSAPLVRNTARSEASLRTGLAWLPCRCAHDSCSASGTSGLSVEKSAASRGSRSRHRGWDEDYERPGLCQMISAVKSTDSANHPLSGCLEVTCGSDDHTCTLETHERVEHADRMHLVDGRVSIRPAMLRPSTHMPRTLLGAWKRALASQPQCLQTQRQSKIERTLPAIRNHGVVEFVVNL